MVGEFRAGGVQVLVATEMTVRSLALQANHVINYELPKASDQYLQRASRLQREVGVGRMSTMVDRAVEVGQLGWLRQLLEEGGQAVPRVLAGH